MLAVDMLTHHIHNHRPEIDQTIPDGVSTYIFPSKIINGMGVMIGVSIFSWE